MLIKRKNHTVPSLNTTSTADISFMLLIFFLVTSSMDVDSGIERQLPPMDDNVDEQEFTEVSKDNTLSFKIDERNRVLLNGNVVSVDGLRSQIQAFLKPRTKSHVIYIDSDPNADYDVYFKLENEIVAAYNNVRNDIANKCFKRSYAMCSEQQKKSVRQMCPQHIAEAYNEYK